MSIIPDLPPKVFTLSAAAVGYILIDDLSMHEQNAIGNWLMLVAQVLCTNAYFVQLQNDRHKTTYNMSDKDVLIMLKKMVDALNKEIQDIKSKL